MIRVGITGGMGCGKSTVMAEFKRLGVPCFVSDIVAASYYNDIFFLDGLRALLGNDVFIDDVTVDKRAVAAKVFADKTLLQGLNAMIHPRVMDDFNHFCFQHSDEPYVLFESAILYDYGFDRLMDKVICVYLDFDERLQRLKLRDGVGEEAIRVRIANQLPAEEIMMKADYVILNYEGNPRRRQVEYIDKLLKQ